MQSFLLSYQAFLQDTLMLCYLLPPAFLFFVIAALPYLVLRMFFNP